MMSLTHLTSYILKVDLQVKPSMGLKKVKRRRREKKGVLWRDGEEERHWPPYFEICCSSECHSPASFLAAEGGQWPGVGDVRAGLSHHQRPGCPATRKGTKGTFDVQGPPLTTLAWTEQQARRTFQLPPRPQPCFLLPEQSPVDSARPPQGTSPSCMAEAWPRSVKGGQQRVSLGLSCVPPPPFSSWD